jgi:hypothetical protein
VRARWQILALLLLLAGCAPLVPAQTPPQLEHTPGAFVVIDMQTYDAAAFQVDYPGGWKVVKLNEAGAPDRVAFVAPDESAVIEIAAGVVGATSPAEGQRLITRETNLQGQTIILSGRADNATWAEFQPVFERVVASIRGKP